MRFGVLCAGAIDGAKRRGGGSDGCRAACGTEAAVNYLLRPGVVSTWLKWRVSDTRRATEGRWESLFKVGNSLTSAWKSAGGLDSMVLWNILAG